MEEGIRRPPGDGVQRINQVACTASLFTVVLTGGVHPIDHFVNGVASLVVAPISVNQATKTHGDRAEIVLERGVV